MPEMALEFDAFLPLLQMLLLKAADVAAAIFIDTLSATFDD